MICFACPGCGRVHEADDEAAGTRVGCACGREVTVPAGSEAPAVRSAPARPPDAGEGAEGAPGFEPAAEAAACWNHPDDPAEAACAACGQPFCQSCLVRLQGRTLCGPCKNLRLRRLERPTRGSPLALLSLIIALAAGPFGFCVLVGAATAQAPAFGVIGLLPDAAALLLGWVALRKVESDPALSGRGLAITGLVTATAGACLTVLFMVLVGRNSHALN